jgi:hypothetical protein
MTDCYDTRSFPQSLIDAILELWDAAGNEGPRLVTTEVQEPQDTADKWASDTRA